MYRDFDDRRRMFKSSLLLTEQKIDRGRRCNRTSTSCCLLINIYAEEGSDYDLNFLLYLIFIHYLINVK